MYIRHTDAITRTQPCELFHCGRAPEHSVSLAVSRASGTALYTQCLSTCIDLHVIYTLCVAGGE